MIMMGDTHNILPIFELIDSNDIQNSNIIHVGDVGIGFLPEEHDIHNLMMLDSVLEETGNMLYLNRGNHDFKKWWEEGEFKDSIPKFRNIMFVPDYSIIEIEGQNVLFLGGAISIDRSSRKRMIPSTWDEDEKIVYDEERIKEIRDVNVVVTHNCPQFVGPQTWSASVEDFAKREYNLDRTNLKEELTEERMNLTMMWMILKENNNISHWATGHMHSSHYLNVETCIFKGLSINELYELK